MNILSDERVFKPGDIVIKKYLGINHQKVFFVLEDSSSMEKGYYLCYDFADQEYMTIFLGYAKGSKKIKKVA